ncbi:TetR/AcrR family transcriptional regulator [Bacillus dakarensis]|uniref:TetR/AcrR family transcriptional regulator n=1 Tax=Robertmurraya dakarensis TaxID=1926278 RepID=UPI000981506D|nr:TetR/AcrR family transcriptional regulator [Bacillus dakarensis]
MNARKQQVIKKAHELFIEKGFQSTSIQDILEYSGIAKGTFYNYFSSKNELLIELFKTIYKTLEKERNDLLIGQDPSDIEIFIKQIEMAVETNRANKLFSLFEEVLVLNDDDLNQFFKNGNLRMLRWLYYRFIDIFGEVKKPYLLDCAIMFTGILQHNLKYTSLTRDTKVGIKKIVRYSVERIVKMVDEVSMSKEQLIPPEHLEIWLPNDKDNIHTYKHKLHHHVTEIKKSLYSFRDQSKYIELLDFIQDELLHSSSPRKHLVESALQSLRPGVNSKEIQELKELITAYYETADTKN